MACFNLYHLKPFIIKDELYTKTNIYEQGVSEILNKIQTDIKLCEIIICFNIDVNLLVKKEFLSSASCLLSLTHKRKNS